MRRLRALVALVAFSALLAGCCTGEILRFENGRLKLGEWGEENARASKPESP